jgi:predicted nuclease with TOPRIM domain
VEDREIMGRIGQLVDEEHELLHQGEQRMGLTPEERERLHALQVEVDQLWDLLRQRRGRRHAGLDPDGAHVRPASTVERYQQ